MVAEKSVLIRKTWSIATALFALALFGTMHTSHAQDPEAIKSGEFEYQASCEACHGSDGKGTGPMADVMKVPPADLTVLAKNNNGLFPFLRVIETIDGRFEAASHGGREMPIWGIRYREHNDPAAARGLILDLTMYLSSIQAE
ncbi:MAG: c-type cytochrome [Gammaproteobacteria bacterium]|nr:c-type cytochrome [Gammaproteobacteria bacterium]